MGEIKSNRNWTLIITFFLMLILFVFISFRLFAIQYSDTDIVKTHDPKVRVIEAPRGNIL